MTLLDDRRAELSVAFGILWVKSGHFIRSYFLPDSFLFYDTNETLISRAKIFLFRSTNERLSSEMGT